VQPGRGQKAVARIRVLHVHRAKLGDLSPEPVAEKRLAVREALGQSAGRPVRDDRLRAAGVGAAFRGRRPMTSPVPLLTIPQVAARLSLGRSTVYRMLEDGR
jgi:hypothetical protein